MRFVYTPQAPLRTGVIVTPQPDNFFGGNSSLLRLLVFYNLANPDGWKANITPNFKFKSAIVRFLFCTIRIVLTLQILPVP